MKPTKVNVFCICFIIYSFAATALCYVYGDKHLGSLSVSALILLPCYVQGARIVVPDLDKKHLNPYVVTVLCYVFGNVFGILSTYTFVLFLCSAQAVCTMRYHLGKERLYMIMNCCKALAIGMPILTIVVELIFSFDPQRPFWEVFIGGMRVHYYVVGIDDMLLFYSLPLLLFIFVHKKFILPLSEYE